MKKVLVCVLWYLLFVTNVCAQVKLSPLFSDNMVLQQKTEAPVSVSYTHLTYVYTFKQVIE